MAPLRRTGAWMLRINDKGRECVRRGIVDYCARTAAGMDEGEAASRSLTQIGELIAGDLGHRVNERTVSLVLWTYILDQECP